MQPINKQGGQSWEQRGRKMGRPAGRDDGRVPRLRLQAPAHTRRPRPLARQTGRALPSWLRLLGLVPGVCMLGIHHKVHQQGLGGEAGKRGAHAGHHARARLFCGLLRALQDHLIVHLGRQGREEGGGGGRRVCVGGGRGVGARAAGRELGGGSGRATGRQAQGAIPRSTMRPAEHVQRRLCNRSGCQVALPGWRLPPHLQQQAPAHLSQLGVGGDAQHCGGGDVGGRALDGRVDGGTQRVALHSRTGEHNAGSKRQRLGRAGLAARRLRITTAGSACVRPEADAWQPASPGRPCSVCCARRVAGGGGPGWW